MKTKIGIIVLAVMLTIAPLGTNAGYDLNTRQLWPILPSDQIQALVLEYHLIENKPEDAKYPDLYVKPETFDKHLQMLREMGIKCISFENAINQLQAGNFDSSNIILTFDDGYLDNYGVAGKLSALGQGCSFYIPTFYPGRSFPKLHLIHMSWDDIKKISDMGFEIGSHTVHHQNLQTCKPEAVNYEISESIKDIYDKIGKKPVTFSVPMGKYTSQVLVEVEKYGLIGCVTSNYGYLNKFNINNSPRIKIVEDTSMRSVIMLYLSRNLKSTGELRRSMKGSRVRSFRTMLTRVGHPLTDGEVYDADMEKAVKEFQKNFQLEETGQLNTTTMDRIISDFISLVVKGI